MNTDDGRWLTSNDLWSHTIKVHLTCQQNAASHFEPLLILYFDLIVSNLYKCICLEDSKYFQSLSSNILISSVLQSDCSDVLIACKAISDKWLMQWINWNVRNDDDSCCGPSTTIFLLMVIVSFAGIIRM